MIREIESRTTPPPPNISYMVPRDTGCRPIHISEALTILCLFIHLIVPVGLELHRL